MVIAGICLLAVVGVGVYWKRRNSKKRDAPMDSKYPVSNEDFRIL